MPKPDWLAERERKNASRRAFKRCITCAVGGDPCGYTTGTGKDRKVMYRCHRFPSVTFYDKTWACEHYEPRN